MDQRRDVVRRHVADMLAVERGLRAAFARQRADERLDRHPHARTLVTRSEDALQRQIEALAGCVDPPPGDEAAPCADGVAAELGARLRIGGHVSCVLRDGYTALAFASVCYEMLHTTALAAGDGAVAALALRHLEELAPLAVALSEAIPEVITAELRADGQLDAPASDVADEARRNACRAWEQAASHAVL